MVQSKFQEFIDRGFQPLVLKTQNTLNGLEGEQRYFHQEYLETKFSLDGKWTSLSSNNKSFVADVVSMDSSLPLKSRGSLGRASGDIFKMGQRYQLREQELTELDTLIATGQSDEAVRRFFDDVPKVIKSVPERNEALFLELLSTGQALVIDGNSTGTTGVRISADIPNDNKFGSTLPWSNVSATPISDLRKLIEKSEVDGRKIIRFLMNRSDFNKLRKSTEAKNMYAVSMGNFTTNTFVPTPNAFIETFTDELGASIQIIERSVTYQKNGVDYVEKPWKDGQITAVTGEKVGSLVWARLAEMNHPVDGVSYQTVNSYILVAKFRENTPALMEVTTSQARVCPVLNNVEGIYMLDSTLTTP